MAEQLASILEPLIDRQLDSKLSSFLGGQPVHRTDFRSPSQPVFRVPAPPTGSTHAPHYSSSHDQPGPSGLSIREETYEGDYVGEEDVDDLSSETRV